MVSTAGHQVMAATPAAPCLRDRAEVHATEHRQSLVPLMVTVISWLAVPSEETA